MNVTPASVERILKCVSNFEIYRFLKKNGQFTSFSPTAITQRARVTCLVIEKLSDARLRNQASVTEHEVMERLICDFPVSFP